MAELIQRDDSLNTGREKLNEAIKASDRAEGKSDTAVFIANTAKSTAESIDGKASQALGNSTQAVSTANTAKETADTTREEMVEIIREQTNGGDIVPEVVQARGGEPTLGANLNSIRQGLAQNETKISQTESKLTQKTIYAPTNHSYSGGLRKTRKPLITIINDDAYRNLHAEFKQLLDSRGMVACEAAVSQYTFANRENNWMNIEELVALQDDGWEIMSHSYSGIALGDITSPDVLTRELKRSKEELESYGLDIRGIVYPFGSYNERVLAETRKYYEYGFGKLGWNQYPIRSNLISRHTFDPGWASLGDFKDYVDRTITNNRWLIINTHYYQYDSTRRAEFAELLDHIVDSGVEVVTAREAMEYYGNISEHYNENTGENVTINPSGRLYINGEAVNQVEEENVRTLSDKEYKSGITLTPITDGHAISQGFPEGVGGLLETVRAGEVLYQRYVIKNSKRIFYRYMRTTGAWGDFSRVPIVDKITFRVEARTVPANSVININIPYYFYTGGVVHANPDTSSSTLENIAFSCFYHRNNNVSLRIINPTTQDIELSARDWIITSS